MKWFAPNGRMQPCVQKPLAYEFYYITYNYLYKCSRLYVKHIDMCMYEFSIDTYIQTYMYIRERID